MSRLHLKNWIPRQDRIIRQTATLTKIRRSVMILCAGPDRNGKLDDAVSAMLAKPPA